MSTQPAQNVYVERDEEKKQHTPIHSAIYMYTHRHGGEAYFVGHCNIYVVYILFLVSARQHQCPTS